MNVHILDSLVPVPGIFYKGRVLLLQRDDRELVLLLEDATEKDAREFCERFCRKSGFGTIFSPFRFNDYDDHVRGVLIALNQEGRA